MFQGVCVFPKWPLRLLLPPSGLPGESGVKSQRTLKHSSRYSHLSGVCVCVCMYIFI